MTQASVSSVSPSRSPAGRASPSPPWIVLVIVSLGMLMVELDTTVVNIALPSIQRALGFSARDLQWVINAFLLCFGGFMLLAGRAADLLGRKRLFVTGMLAFGAGSALAGAAPSAGLLLAARVLQGLGGAMLSPTALSILTTTFTDPAERNKAMGVWGSIQAGGVALGLILGGIITDTLSWRWIFFINLPIAAVALAGALRYVPESAGRAPGHRLDMPGAVTITAALAALTYVLTNGRAWGWGSARTAGLLAAAAVLLAGFVAIEFRSRSPLVRPGIFRLRTLSVGNAGFMLTSSGMFGMFYFSSLYVQEVLGYSPLRSGLALLPLTIGVLGGAGLAQLLIQRAGLRVTTVSGLIIGAAGGLVLTRISVHGDYFAVFLPGLLVLALGIGLSMVPFTLLATTGVAEDEAGLASGLYTTVSYIGGAVGLAGLSALAIAGTASRHVGGGPQARLAAQVSGYHVAFFSSAVLLAAGALLIVALVRRRHVSAIGREEAHESEPAESEGRR